MRRTRARAVCGVAALVLTAPLAAQEEDRPSEGREFGPRLDTIVAFNRGGTIDLSLLAGEVVVTGWDREQVKVAASTEGGVIRFGATRGHLTLRARPRRGHAEDVRFELSVPTGARVVAQSVSASLSVRGIKGEVDVSSVSGDIAITDAGGRIAFESVAGAVSGVRLAGDISGDVISGDLDIDGATGEIDVEAVSGDVTLRRVRSGRVGVETVSGNVEYYGGVDAGGRYEFTSHSGELRLVLPAAAGGVVSLETFSGEIESEFPMTLRPSGRHAGERGKRLEFTLGRGTARILLETFSGNITIEQGSGPGAKKEIQR